MSVVARARFAAAIRLIQTTNAFIVSQATGVSASHWHLIESAPSTLEGVQHQYGEALKWGFPLPVSPLGLERSMYMNEHDNAQFRAAHDLLHYFYGFEFTLHGEVSAALTHCHRVAAYGMAHNWEETTIRDAVTLLWLDTAGQAEYHASTRGGFLRDQRAFILPKFINYLIDTAGTTDPVRIGVKTV